MTDEQNKQEESAGLSVQDLSSLKTIIDVASQRGAFKPNEMAQVGATYNKLDSFLSDIAKQQEAAQTTASDVDGNQESELSQGE